MSIVSSCCRGNIVNYDGTCELCGKPCDSIEGFYLDGVFRSFEEHAASKLATRAAIVIDDNPYMIDEFAKDDKGFSLIYYVEGDLSPKIIGFTVEQFARLAQQAGWFNRQYVRAGYVEETDEDFSNEEQVDAENTDNWNQYWNSLDEKYLQPKWRMDNLIKFHNEIVAPSTELG